MSFLSNKISSLKKICFSRFYQKKTTAIRINPYNKHLQWIVVAVSLIVTIFLMFLLSTNIWNYLCDDSILSCFNAKEISYFEYFLLATLRSLTFLPYFIFCVITVKSYILADYNLYEVYSLIVFSSILSVIIPLFFARVLNKLFVKSFLMANMPKTLKKLQNNSNKLCFVMRTIFIIPFDLINFFIGLLGIKLKKSIVSLIVLQLFKSATFIILINYFINYYSNQGNFSSFSAFSYLLIFFINEIFIFFLCLFIMILINLMFYLSGRSYIKILQTNYYRWIYEIHKNNIVADDPVDFDPNTKYVLLLYGFFASRRTLKVMQKLLKSRGYKVFTLNLGGLLGVFFTKNIIKSAQHLDSHLKSLIIKNQKLGKEFNPDQLSIVAHSKGGLVAAWWLLRLGGHKYCTKLITLGTPFCGTYVTWLGLITPLGFFWSDIWQMRPYSNTLKSLRKSYIPEKVRIYCFYSKNDYVSRDKTAILETKYGTTHNVIAVPMHECSHFEYLYRKKVADRIKQILS